MTSLDEKRVYVLALSNVQNLEVTDLKSWEEKYDESRGMTGVLRLIEQDLESREQSSCILDVFVVKVHPLLVVCNDDFYQQGTFFK